MRKPFFKIFLIIISALLIFFITACTDPANGTDDEPFVVTIRIDPDTVPINAIAGDKNLLSNIKLIVTMSDGIDKSISVTEDMIFITDKPKLNQQGSHQISVIYGGMSAKFWLTLQEAPIVKYELHIENGSIKGQTPTDGKWKGTFESGTRVTIVAIDKSDESLFFTEWTINGQTVNKNATCEITVDRNITIVANYSNFTFNVTFDPDGGTSVSQKKASEIAECPITTREEYVFVRWIEADTLAPVTFPYKVERNVTLKAIWESLGLVYEKRLGDNGYTIIDYIYEGSRTTLEIPLTHGENQDELPVIRIAKDAFKNAVTLETLVIPKDLREIEDYSFSNCVNLTNITVHPNNAYFRDDYGVLLNKEADKIIAYPAGRMQVSYEVQNISEIGVAAFYNANLGSINIRSTLSSIGADSFNSRTIDNVIFNNRVSSDMNFSENIFNDNISKILILQSTHIDGYLNHPSFIPYRDKIEEYNGSTSIGIFENLLYRIVSREIEGIPQSTIEIIGARRNITQITIPAISIEGKRITSIGSYAFSYCYNLETIEFPQQMHVNRIMKGAFENTKWQNEPNHNNIVDDYIIINNILFTSLQDRSECIIPYYVLRIAEGAFSNMTKLQSVIFNKDGNDSRYITSIDAKAFINCVNLKNITIPKTVNSIGERAFENTDLRNFAFESGSNLKVIKDFCFRNATNLTVFDLGVNVEEIGVGVFNDCYSLERISVNNDINGNSEFFKSVDGVLYQYNKNLVGDTDTFGQILHTYPAGRLEDVYRLPYEGLMGVTHILEYAFYYSNIGAIVLSPTIESIVENSIVIPHLLYLEFQNTINVSSYEIIFPQFGPDYVVIQNDDNANYSFWAPEDIIKKKSQMEMMGIDLGVTETAEGYRFIYRKDMDGMFIIGADRTKEELVIPAKISINFIEYDVVGLEGYAFMGSILEEVSLPSTLNIIKAYAFYYSDCIKRIISYKQTVPALEYGDPDQPETVLSFNPKNIIESALIYVPANREQLYADFWPTSIDFILEIGTQPEVIFDPNGGSDPVLINQETGLPYDLSALEIIPDSPVTERTGYIFDGWYEDELGTGEEIVFPYTKYKKAVLYAKWLVRSFEISYQLGGGEFEEENPLNVVYYGEPYILPVPIRAGYDFIGWADFDGNMYTDELGQGLSNWNTIDENLVLIAKWQKKDIIVTYDATGGTTSQPTETITYLSVFTLEIPTKVGYKFLRWEDEQGSILTYSNGEGINNWSYTEDITVYAVWQALTFTVYFSDGYGTTITPAIVTFGDEDYTFEIPVRENSVFFGWYDGLGGTGTQYTDENGQSVRAWDIPYNVTLYAQWPIGVSTFIELNNIRDNLSGSFILVNDITITEEWIPIGIDNNTPFTGILDGNGYSIYNMSITNKNSGYVGLIGYNKGIVRNLNLGINEELTDRTNRAVINITDSSDTSNLYIGGLVGYNDIVGNIINCNVAVEITTVVDYSTNYLYVGGLTGKNQGLIKETYVVTQITTSIDEQSTQPENMYKGTITGYHAIDGIIEECNYYRLVSSADEITNACGNENTIEDFGSYDAIGQTAQDEW